MHNFVSYRIGILFIILNIIAFILPSSVNGQENMGLSLVNLITLLLLIFFSYLYTSEIDHVSMFLVFIVVFLFILFSLFTPYSAYAWGQLLRFLPLALFLTLKPHKRIKIEGVIIGFYILILYISIAGWLSLGEGYLNDYIINYYSAGYEGMVERMLLVDKPVSIFGSHSIAAFFYYTFILTLLYLTYKRVGNYTFNILAIINFVVMLFFLASASSSFFIFLSIITVIYFNFIDSNVEKNKYLLLFFVFSVITVLVILVFDGSIFKVIVLGGDMIYGDSGNGFSSRYFDGVLAGNMEHIAGNPLRGIGFSYDEKFYYTDSAYIVSTLKLGVLGCIIYLIAAFRNISSFSNKTYKIFFCLAVFSFAFGYPIFEYLRFIPLIIMVYLVTEYATVVDDA